MIDYKDIIKNRELRIRVISGLKFIPDRTYLKLVYRVKTGKKLNLDNPIGFNEKLNWLKIHDIHPEYSKLADKYSVRKIVTDEIGEEYLFPLLGVWDRFEDINFEELPDQFVLKCVHDSGSVRIIKNKAKINMIDLKKFLNGRLMQNTYYLAREYPYKKIRPRIMAEKYMSADDGSAPNDYKFFCFNGEPKFMFVATDREKDVTHTVLDMDFKRIPVNYVHKQVAYDLQKPDTFEEMKIIARKLSTGIRFVRIDLYEVGKRVYFGEYTFFPAGGFYLFSPDQYEKKFGNMLNLPELLD